ncbi:MAG TPA: hypothetical protein VFR99_00560 [Marmoricola sp.]|nr:hypothetical protein [Marmoricola sp.]
MPKRLVVLVAATVLVVTAAVVGGVTWWHRAHRTDLERALAVVPQSSLRVGFTDWAAVRQRLHVHGTDRAAVRRLQDRAYDADLSAASSIDEEGVALQRLYGFGPATATWEAYAQSRQGAALVLRLPDDTDFDDLAANLRDLGYRQPATDDGVWRGGVDLVASLDPSLNPEVQYVALLADQHLVVASDRPAYAATAARVAAGDGASLADLDSARTMVSTLGDPAAAMVWARDFACRDLAMSQADAGDQREADQLIHRAGPVSPLSGLVMAMAPDRTLTVAEQFESTDQARENLRARARLAVGDAVGRGGSFADDFRLTSSRATGSTVLLTMKPKQRTGFVLSALYDGPVIFATC